jgi:hypothetical protein
MQDTSLQESMGPIQDRTKEHLVSSDKIIVMARRMLLAAATSLHPTTTPPGTSPASQRVRSAATVLAVDVPVIKSVKPSLEVKEGEPYLTH